MSDKSKNDTVIIVPPGYEYLADTLNNDPNTSLRTIFLDSVDSTFLDTENYAEESPEIQTAELPQPFKDYAA